MEEKTEQLVRVNKYQFLLSDLAKRRLSYSSLKHFKKSPEHFIEYVFGPKKETSALTMGKIIDKLVLEPDEFEKVFVVIPNKPKAEKLPDMPLLKTVGKEAYEAAKVAVEDCRVRNNKALQEWEAICAKNADKVWITQEQYDECKFIADKVFANEHAMKILNQITRTQRELTWVDKKTGLKMVGFVDGDGEGETQKGIVAELKTTKDADPRKFLQDCIKFDYPFQLGLYAEGYRNTMFKFPDFYYISVETKAPYGILVHKVSDEYLQYGKEQFRKTLDKYKYCLDNNLFDKSYDFNTAMGYNRLELPKYLITQLEE